MSAWAHGRPRSLKTMRAKWPKGTIIQARIQTESGMLLEYEGDLTMFDKMLAKIRERDARAETKPEVTPP